MFHQRLIILHITLFSPISSDGSILTAVLELQGWPTAWWSRIVLIGKSACAMARSEITSRGRRSSSDALVTSSFLLLVAMPLSYLIALRIGPPALVFG